MCIAIVSTAHPDYPVIILSNRDEYLHRPTSVAQWWPEPHSHILGGRDLHRSEHGTWLGITKQGRIACLTNYREHDKAIVEGRRSRGAIVNAYLKTPQESKEESMEVAGKLIAEGLSGVGGFSLIFGRLRRPGWQKGSEEKEKEWEGLAIVSNRSAHVDDVMWICKAPGETHALSNAVYGDRTWNKVVDGERLVVENIQEAASKNESPDEMINRFLKILSADTLPAQKPGELWEDYMTQLKKSIFIRAVGKDKKTTVDGQSPLPQANVDRATSGGYGTQKQSIILVDWQGRVTFFERTLFDEDGKPIERGKGDLQFQFEVESWNE